MLQLPLHHEHSRKSLLFQDGLEIRYVITVTMIATVRGHLLLLRYEQFVKNLYAELKDEVIVGCYLTKTNLSIVQMTGFVQRGRERTQRMKRKAKTSVTC